MYIAVQGSPESNKVNIDGAKFIENICTLNGGGGVDVGFLFHSNRQPKRNKIQFSNSEFVHNQAEYGGGALVYSSSALNFENEIGFENCMWTKNRAVFGAAVNLGTHTWDTLKRGYLPTPVFIDCSFTLNSVDKHLFISHNDSVEGKGTFVAVGMDVFFRGMTNFTQNNNTALYLVSCFQKIQT